MSVKYKQKFKNYVSVICDLKVVLKTLIVTHMMLSVDFVKKYYQ